jgi:hypothetical protein
MTRLEDLTAGTSARGLSPEGLARIVAVEWYGDQAIKVVYEDGVGATRSRLLFREDEDSLRVEIGSGHAGTGGWTTSTAWTTP